MRGSILEIFWGASLLSLVVTFAPAARAADPKEWGDESAAEDEKNQEKPPAPEAAPDAAAAAAGANAVKEAEPAPAAIVDETAGSEAGPAEDSDYLLGLRYRGLFIPKAVLNWFIEGGRSLYVNGIGPEFSIRNDNVEYVLSAWLAFYQLDPVALKGSSDAEEAWEIVDSQMKSLYLTFDYLWHHPLSRTLELSYGGGAGLGFLFGDLHRTQATLTTGGTRGDAGAYVKCDGVDMPAQGGYCDDINTHYDGYGEPNWFHGGAKPVLFPWVTGQVGLRYQAHPKFVARLDLGLGTSGLYFGVGADYGL
jgi:hypothetical protein